MPDESRKPPIRADSAQLVGVWATHVRVTRTHQEFCVDFIREDPFQPEKRILVSRVALSSFLAARLRDLLARQIDSYTKNKVNREFSGDTDEPAETGP
jgi:hypothetical protein